jgi:8-oxo-dGTP diphosphatase / 2-hydroxy-dATP diphosphatase
MKKIVTLCLVQKSNQILLGMKKRGFGAGHFNGFGGKVEMNETIEAGAARELYEEAGITALHKHKIGQLTFTFREEPGLELEMHIFKVTEFEGVPIESDEMCPQWFAVCDIPYTKMWSSDVAWFPLYLKDQRFCGSFHFDKPANTEHTAVILEQTLVLIEEF